MMKRRFVLTLVVVLVIILCLPLTARALNPNDRTVPVVPSGSFVCPTWLNTSMDFDAKEE